jgi:hypothetical protein
MPSNVAVQLLEKVSPVHAWLSLTDPQESESYYRSRGDELSSAGVAEQLRAFGEYDPAHRQARILAALMHPGFRGVEHGYEYLRTLEADPDRPLARLWPPPKGTTKHSFGLRWTVCGRPPGGGAAKNRRRPANAPRNPRLRSGRVPTAPRWRRPCPADRPGDRPRPPNHRSRTEPVADELPVQVSFGVGRAAVGAGCRDTADGVASRRLRCPPWPSGEGPLASEGDEKMAELVTPGR